jgi:hypothetical protein
MPDIHTRTPFKVRGVVGEHLRFVPPLKLWIIQNINCYGSMDVLGGGNILISDGEADVTLVYFEWLALERSSKQWSGRHVIEYNQGNGAFRVQNFTAYPVDVCVTVYELDDPTAQPP